MNFKTRKLIKYEDLNARGTLFGGQMLKFYRYLRIGIHNGYIHVHKQKLFAAFIRVLSKSFYLILRMSRFDKERLTFNFKVDKTL